MPSRARPRLLARLDGPPWRLPALLDSAIERWWALPPRGRIALLAALTVAVPLVVLVASDPPTPLLVAVADTDLPAGRRVAADDWRQERWPPSLAPPGAANADPTGRVTSTFVPAGAAIVDAHLDDQGVGGRLGRGRAAVPAPAAELPPLTVGQRVDVLAGGLDGRGRVLAAGARVVATDGGTVWLDVGRDQAAAVAGALAGGLLTVAALPP